MRRRPETEDSLWCHPHQTMHPKTFFGKSRHTASGFMFACREIVSQKNRKAHAKARERNNLRHRGLREKRMSSPERIVWVLKRLLDSARKHAAEGGLEFRLTLTDLEPVEKCPVFGWNLVYGANGKQRDNSASLDRIDSRLGYVPGNVWFISWKANRVKMDSTPDELRAVADAVDRRLNAQ